MKPESKKLSLSKRTIAHLNQKSMSSVKGGDGNIDQTTRKLCGLNETLDPTDKVKEVTRTFISMLVNYC